MEKQKVDFNKEWAQSVSKADFIEHEKHHAAIVDLGEEWEKLNADKPKADKAKGVKTGEEDKK